jgi:hypothetical protein
MIIPQSPYTIFLNWSVYFSYYSSFKDSEHILIFHCEGPTFTAVGEYGSYKLLAEIPGVARDSR